MSDPADDAGKRRVMNRSRSVVLGCCLGAMVVLVYLVTLVRLVRP